MRRIVSVYHFSASRLFVFAGQGTQQKGMFKAVDKLHWQKVLQKSVNILGIDLWEIATSDKDSIINQTEITQPLLLLSHYLHFHDKKYHLNLSQNDFMVGHSLGEFSALVNAGSLSLEDGLALVQQRGRLMKKYTTVPHAMLIVKYPIEKLSIVEQQIKKADLQIACVNSRTNVVVAGVKDKITVLIEQLKKQKITSMLLPVSTAFHCRMLQNMKEQFANQLQKIHFQKPKCKIVRNFDCQIYASEQDIRSGLVKQLTNPVLFYDSIKLIPKSVQLIQVGHRKSISKLVQQTRSQMLD